MPGFDGTGPRGDGPMTGGGFGYCGTPGYRGSYGYGNAPYRGLGRGGRPWGGGRGFGYGGGRRRGGRGRGFRAWGPAYGPDPAYEPAPGYGTPAPEDEVNYLKEQAEWLKQELKNINDRIDTLTRPEGGSG
jgi:hypothetical protein